MKNNLFLFEFKKITMLLAAVLGVYNVSAQKFEDKSYLKKNQPASDQSLALIVPDSKYGLVVSQYNLVDALKNPDVYKSARFYNAGLKEFPEQLFLFKNLEEIDLASNQLTVIPERLNEFKNLKELYLNKNKLTSFGPEIIACQQLRVLHIHDNPLQTISPEIGKMKTLLEINLGQIAAGCAIPAELWTLTNLEEIKITNANLTEIPAGIANFHQLYVLCLTQNAITVIPDEVYNLKTLKSLELGYNNIKVISPAVARLENLTSLGVFCNPVSTIPAEITGLKNLSYIRCWKTRIPQKEIDVLRTKLPEVRIQNTETGIQH